MWSNKKFLPVLAAVGVVNARNGSMSAVKAAVTFGTPHGLNRMDMTNDELEHIVIARVIDLAQTRGVDWMPLEARDAIWLTRTRPDGQKDQLDKDGRFVPAGKGTPVYFYTSDIGFMTAMAAILREDAFADFAESIPSPEADDAENERAG